MNDTFVSLSQAEFHEKFQSLHDMIFSGQEDSDVPDECYLPFVDRHWERVLLEEGILTLPDEDLRALAIAAEKMGDGQIIITDSETRPPHQMPVIATWNAKILDQARTSTLLDHFKNHTFGRSGTWGLVYYWDEFSILGGTSVFMEAFFEAAGGRQRVKERFLSFAGAHWWASVDPPSQVKILKSVGWSFGDASL
jgi:hypothetical protein